MAAPRIEWAERMVVWWEGPDALKPHRMAAFFDPERADEAAATGTG